MEPYQNGLIYKLKKSRAKFDDVNFSLSPVETAIRSRRQTEFDAMFTDFFLIMEFASLRLYQQMKEDLKIGAWRIRNAALVIC